MTNNKKKPLSKFMEAMSHKRIVQFSRLTGADIPQISAFLNSIWSQYYGKTGSPVFDEDYLHWVYGGPNKVRNLFLGAFVNNELVAYQAFLFRKIACSKKELNSYLNTHLAVSPRLDLRARLDCGLQLCEQAPLFHPNSPYYDADCDAVFGFIEAAKTLKSVGDKMLAQHFQIDRKTCSTFNQCVLSPDRLKKYVAENPCDKRFFTVRGASKKDISGLTALFNQLHEGSHFVMLMTEEELRHYFFGHASHRTFLVEDEGGIRILLNFYPLETIKEDNRSVYIIVEFLIADQANEANKPYIAALLLEAVKYAEEISAKGVVFENATYLNYNIYRFMGMLPTFRKMTLSMMTKDNSFNYSGSFRCDIK